MTYGRSDATKLRSAKAVSGHCLLAENRQQRGRRGVYDLARRPDALASRVSPSTEGVAGDVLDPASLVRALDGIDVAYYWT